MCLRVLSEVKMLSGEVMSVLIYGIDNEAKGFPTLIVSSEVNFHTIWELAINELPLTIILNHHWKLRDVTCKKHLKSFCKQVHIL